MPRLQIVVSGAVESKVRAIAAKRGVSVSAAGAQLLAEAVETSPKDDPWFKLKPFPSRQPKSKQVSGKDHDEFLYGLKRRR